MQNSTFPWEQTTDYALFTEAYADFLNTGSANDHKKETPDISFLREQFLYSSGLHLIDYESGTVLPDREGLRMVSDFCKEIQHYFTYYNEIDYYNALSQYFSVDNYYAHEKPLYITNPFFIYTEGIGQFTTEPQFNSGSTQVRVLPTVIQEQAAAVPGISAAIRNGTPNVHNAYFLLKDFLNEGTQGTLLYSTPVNKVQLHRIIYSYRNPDNADILYNQIEAAIPYTQFSTKLWEIFVQYMTPYWEGNASYDQCVSELEAMLELYMYE